MEGGKRDAALFDFDVGQAAVFEGLRDEAEDYFRAAVVVERTDAEVAAELLPEVVDSAVGS